MRQRDIEETMDTRTEPQGPQGPRVDEDHDKQQRSTLVLKVHFCCVMHVIGLFMQININAFKVQKLEIDAVGLGLLETTFSILQLVGGPIFGRFGDLFGSQAAMMLALGSSSMCYLATGMADSFWLLFVSRIPAFFMHANQASQMIITDVTASRNRADSLGKLGVSFGIGMVIGPILGGQVTGYFSEEASSYLASALSALALLFTWILIPNNTKQYRSQDTKESTKNGDKAVAIFSVRKWWELLQQPGVLTLLLVKGIAGLPFGAFQSMSSLIFIQKFGLEPSQIGLVLSYIGIIIMLVQGFGVGFLSKNFSETNMIRWSNFVLIWTWLFFAHMTSIYQYCLVMIPQAFGIAIQNVVISSVLTKSVSTADTGALLGLNAAVHATVRTVSPGLGGYIFATYGFPAIGYFGSVVSMCMTVCLFTMFRVHTQ